MKIHVLASRGLMILELRSINGYGDAGSAEIGSGEIFALMVSFWK